MLSTTTLISHHASSCVACLRQLRVGYDVLTAAAPAVCLGQLFSLGGCQRLPRGGALSECIALRAEYVKLGHTGSPLRLTCVTRCYAPGVAQCSIQQLSIAHGLSSY